MLWFLIYCRKSCSYAVCANENSGKKRRKSENKNEKREIYVYVIRIRIMSLRIHRHPECSFKFSLAKPYSFIWYYDNKWRQRHITICLMVVDQRHTLTKGRLQGRLSIVLARTHPKAILNEDGDPGGPNCWPKRIARLNTSALRIESKFPGVQKSRSASQMFQGAFNYCWTARREMRH